MYFLGVAAKVGSEIISEKLRLQGITYFCLQIFSNFIHFQGNDFEAKLSYRSYEKTL